MTLLALALAGVAQKTAVNGTVQDALGRAVAGAAVEVLGTGGAVLARTSTDASGNYQVAVPTGAIELEASRRGLATARQAVSAHPAVLVLGLEAAATTINVTALGVPLAAAQLGNTTDTISRADLLALEPLQTAAALRLEPGVGVIQSGATGAVTSVFLRGAPADFTKVLLDGVPIQRLDLGGYDFSNLLPVGVESVALLRGPDSVVYGSDAAAGVIALTTRRGSDVSAPEFDSTTEAGAYHTLVQDNQLLGQWRRFDYALRYGYLDTRNQQPQAAFRDNTYGASVGWKATEHSRLRLNLQRSYADTGQPNAVLFYGLPEGDFKHQGETYASVEWQQQWTPAWTQRVTVSQAQANLYSVVPGPTGVPDGLGDYDGLPVTIAGANGYTVQGQAILSFGGPFPQASPSDTLRRGLNWESEVAVNPRWRLISGYRYDDERGLSSNVALSRHDHGFYTMAAGGWGSRLFVTAGVSADRNTPFGTTANPQASVAWYPRLASTGFWNATRLRASAGTALKDPSLEEEEFSLYQEVLAGPAGAALARQLALTPVRPQRARDWDAGLDQYVAGGRGKLSATWFDQRYYDLVEDIPASAFPLLGISAAVAQAAPFGGEYNSLSERARGLELEARWRAAAHWRLGASYTATAAQVLRSFSFDAEAPSFNPDFPNVPIGAFAPLVGGRPFRAPPQTAGWQAGYNRGRFSGLVSGYWESRRDDSTFLTDANFGNTLLLPNRNLDPAFSVVDMSGTWRVRPGWVLLGAVDNALNRSYQEVIGFPEPRITGRLGVRWTWTP
ncbi:MAG: TonB-dependent receptor [Terriglobales bacterium]